MEVLICPVTPQQYDDKYRMCFIRNDGQKTQVRTACDRIKAYQKTYEQVSIATNIPWALIAALHFRESNLSMVSYLHNGDPLWNSDGKPVPTTHVPKGVGPFDPQNWVTAAVDALQSIELHAELQTNIDRNMWTLGAQLRFAEHYNGLGYRRHGLTSPYLWSMTDQYTQGKYSIDGHYDQKLVDAQPGVAAIFKGLAVKTMRVPIQ